MKVVDVSCESSLKIPYKSEFSLPIILKRDGAIITATGDLLFMIKESIDTPDADAIISKTLTLAHANGDPYHYIIDFDLTDTSNEVGKYFFGFKTTLNGDWLPTTTGIAEITSVIVQGIVA